jgi:hypothetical protein
VPNENVPIAVLQWHRLATIVTLSLPSIARLGVMEGGSRSTRRALGNIQSATRSDGNQLKRPSSLRQRVPFRTDILRPSLEPSLWPFVLALGALS